MSNPISKGIEYTVKIGKNKSFKVTRERTMPTNYFQELLDVSVPGIAITTSNPNRDNFVVAYNSSSNKFTLVDPDAVLVAAASSTGVQPGLPNQFTTVVGEVLDNEIDLDAGTF